MDEPPLDCPLNLTKSQKISMKSPASSRPHFKGDLAADGNISHLSLGWGIFLGSHGEFHGEFHGRLDGYPLVNWQLPSGYD